MIGMKSLMPSIDNMAFSKHISDLLAQGAYEQGWRRMFFERWAEYSYPGHSRSVRPFRSLLHINGRTVAIVREGSYGDMFQFVRYVPLLAARARVVILQVHPSEVRLLFGNLPGNVGLVLSDASDHVSEANIPDEVEHITALFDLPYHFETTLDTIPNELPYLQVPATVLEARQLPLKTRPRVGVVWSEDVNQADDTDRSIPFATLAGFADFDEIEFVSLQMGSPAEADGFPMLRPLHAGFDWLDTAAIVAQLDLVITVDTAVAHLAAAMGVKTWILSRFDPCWRWLGNRPDNPWYPNVARVFGQTDPTDWSTTITAVQAELGHLYR